MKAKSEFTTHHFWTYSRDYARDDAAVDAEIYKGVTFAFEMQNRTIIEAQQASRGTNELTDLRPVTGCFTSRAAGAGVRRIDPV